MMNKEETHKKIYVDICKIIFAIRLDWLQGEEATKACSLADTIADWHLKEIEKVKKKIRNDIFIGIKNMKDDRDLAAWLGDYLIDFNK